jgi:hypothetical protein
VWGNEPEDEFYYAHMALAAVQRTRKLGPSPSTSMGVTARTMRGRGLGQGRTVSSGYYSRAGSSSSSSPEEGGAIVLRK